VSFNGEEFYNDTFSPEDECKNCINEVFDDETLFESLDSIE